jgi:hypothetical protein
MVFVLPIFGTVLAISFDVGYFSGLDINYFTMFTLAEHVVFALEIVPFIVFLIVLLPISFGIGASALQLQKRLTLLLRWGSGAASVAGPYILLHRALSIKTLSLRGLRLVSSSCFFLGLETARALEVKTPMHSLTLRAEGTELRGLLIRGGHRGLLFFDTSTRTISFPMWSDVKRIETVK